MFSLQDASARVTSWTHNVREFGRVAGIQTEGWLRSLGRHEIAKKSVSLGRTLVVCVGAPQLPIVRLVRPQNGNQIVNMRGQPRTRGRTGPCVSSTSGGRTDPHAEGRSLPTYDSAGDHCHRCAGTRSSGWSGWSSRAMTRPVMSEISPPRPSREARRNRSRVDHFSVPSPIPLSLDGPGGGGTGARPRSASSSASPPAAFTSSRIASWESTRSKSRRVRPSANRLTPFETAEFRKHGRPREVQFRYEE